MRVCVAGLGQIGLPVLEYISKKGFKTYGYDIDQNAVKKAIEKGMKATGVWNEIPHEEIKVYVICVSTGWKLEAPDISAIFDICSKIANSCNHKPLVSIESTIPPGTCKMLSEKILRKAYLVHCPHRYWKEDPVRYGVCQIRVIGGIDKKSLRIGLNFYNRLKIPIFPVSKIEIAEMSKIVENSYRFIQIAFAEQVKIICDENDINFEELRKACNTKWNVEILEARNGIGGHCLPKDIRYLISVGKQLSPLLEGALLVDSIYTWHIKRLELSNTNKIDIKAKSVSSYQR